MLDWPGFLVPLWMALFFEPIRKDTIRQELKPIKFEKKIEYVDVSCTIQVKQPTIVFDSSPHNSNTCCEKQLKLKNKKIK